MEHQAESTFVLSDGSECKIRALVAKDLASTGDSIARILMYFSSSKDADPVSLICGAGGVMLDSVIETLTRCSDMSKEKIESLPVGDLARCMDLFLEVNKVEEIIPLFFRMRTKILGAVEKFKKKT